LPGNVVGDTLTVIEEFTDPPIGGVTIGGAKYTETPAGASELFKATGW